MQRLNNNKLLLLLITIGILFRFYNLNWGTPFYFHPDERNIATAVSQFDFPRQLNPNFFAYGSLPLYAIYLLGIIKNLFLNTKEIFTINFSDAILIGRFYSALFSAILIPITFQLGKLLRDKNTGLLAAFFTTFSTGLVQYSHFATFEIWLSLCSALLLAIFLGITKHNHKMQFLKIGVILGILISIKISSLALLPLATIAFYKSGSSTKFNIKSRVGQFFIIIVTVSIIFITSNPFALFDFNSFTSSIRYEGSVASGSLPVFYTQSFHNTQPISYQFINIYPFILNPILTILLVPSILLITQAAFKKNNQKYKILLLIYFLLFVSQALFYVKWTRYMIPTLPFAYLITSLAAFDAFHAFNASKIKKKLIIIMLTVSSSLFCTAFFISTYLRTDTRIEAAKFANNHFPNNSRIITEPYDLGILPYHTNNWDIEYFNFYDYDLDHNTQNTYFEDKLKTVDFIILPSQRVLKSRFDNFYEYPKGHRYYKGLLNGQLGFKRIYQTPCDIFCKIAYLNNPIFRFEETATVFDRPTVMIFEKKN